MKVVPKLSVEQLRILDRLTQSHAPCQAHKAARPMPSTVSRPTQVAHKALFCVADRVELLRDVPDTAYRLGQQGTIQALHGVPPKIAEVEIDDSLYSDVVCLRDLRRI